MVHVSLIILSSTFQEKGVVWLEKTQTLETSERKRERWGGGKWELISVV